MRTLSFHETHEWHPSVLNDGRIIYTRWDYVDRNAAKFHGLWTCNQDGSNPSILFGNYTTRPWACYQAKPIPGSHQIMFVAGGHHANVGGTLMLLDPARIALDADRGEDRLEALRCLSPEIGFAEAEGWPKSYFYSPWPLSEKYFLVAFSHEPLPGGYTGEYRDTETGIYYFDAFGNLELLYRQSGISAVYPIPLTGRPAPRCPPRRPSRTCRRTANFWSATSAEACCRCLPTDVLLSCASTRCCPSRERTTRRYPGSVTPTNPTRGCCWEPCPWRRWFGLLPAPAHKPLCFQAVDDDGRAVHGMRTIVYLQPGERRGCVGCHEPPGSAPDSRLLAATLRRRRSFSLAPMARDPSGTRD